MPDDSLTSGSGEPADGAVSEASGELRRIAILAQDAEQGDALWRAVDRRFRQKDKIAVLRVAREQADLVAHVLSASELADAKAVLAACARISEDSAPLKFVVVPAEATVPDGFAQRTGAAVLSGTASIDEHSRAITRALRTGTIHEQVVEARRLAKAAAKSEDAGKKDKKEPPAPEVIAERKVRNRASKVAIKAARMSAKQASPEVLAAKAQRKQAKRGAKPAAAPVAAKRKKAAGAAAKTKKPAAVSKTKRAKADPKAPAKAKKPALSPQEAAAAKAARKAAKHQAKEQAKAEREAKKQKKPKLSPAEAEAAKAARKAAKEQAKAERETKEQKPALSPEEIEAAKVARKAAKHQAKEQAKAGREKKPKLSPEEAEAAKAARKAAREQAKEQAKAGREAKATKPALSPEEAEAAKAARKAAKHQAKEQAKAERETQKQKKPSPEEVAAAKAARKAAKEQAKGRTKETKPALSPEEVEAAKAARKAAKHQAKEQAKAERETKKQKKPKPSPEEVAAAKAARKAAKEQAKEQTKETKPALSPEEAEAAKAARKAAKHQAKEQAKAERETKKQKKPKPSPEEVAAAKAARKAAKEQAKERTKETKPALSPEEAEAAKAARKAAKHQAKEQAKAQKKPALSPEEVEAAKAARKAAKKQAKPERKAKKPELSPEESDAAKEARKAAKHQAKEQAKAERAAAKKTESSPEDLTAKAEKKAAKREAKAGKKGARKKTGAEGDPEAADGADELRPLKVAIIGVARAAELAPALTDLFLAAGGAIEAVADDAPVNVVVHGFDDPALGPDEIAAQAAQAGSQEARVQIFLERTAPAGDLESVNRAIAGLAASRGGTVLRLASKFRRFASEDIGLVAESVLGIAAEEFPRRNFALPPLRAAPDLVEARTLAPETLLSQLRWNGPSPPKSIWFGMAPDAVKAFADSKMALGGEEPVAFELPIDWSIAWPERRTAQFFKSLEFLTGPLAYWYAKANGNRSENVAGVDAALKERGTTPNALFARATQILVDFIAKQPPGAAPDAWTHNVLERRARVALMYVLCCKSALKRKIKINDAACGVVFAHLLDIVERLRSDDFYEPCSVDGVQQDCLLIGLGLGLRGTAYGNALIKDGLERLKTMQLDPGLTADGVWHTDTYAMHCAVLTSLSQLLGDFPAADAALIEPFAAIAKKMTVFAEAMLKSDGAPPCFDASKQHSYGNKLATHRRSIARAASGGKQNPARVPLRNRVTDTYVFRDAQYFISHSSQKVEPDSSLAVLHADAPSAASGDPGGVVVAFAHADKDLLVRAKPAEKVGAKKDQTPLYDPRLRNGYRIGGEGNAAPAQGSAKTARIVKSWRGPGWAAARSVEDTYANASVARVVVHLKAAHALIVVDELATADGAAAEFEQFWNIAPGFAAVDGLQFSSAESGLLSVAFADAAAAQIDTSESGTSLHRRVHLARATVAAVLQWTDAPAPLEIRLEEDAQGWRVSAAGKGFSARLALAGNAFACDLA